MALRSNAYVWRQRGVRRPRVSLANKEATRGELILKRLPDLRDDAAQWTVEA